MDGEVEEAQAAGQRLLAERQHVGDAELHEERDAAVAEDAAMADAAEKEARLLEARKQELLEKLTAILEGELRGCVEAEVRSSS